MTKTTQGEHLLEVRDLRTRFNTERGSLYAVDGVSFTVDSGRVLCIVGESGSGKSVTVRSLLRLIDPPGEIIGGTAFFHGQDLLSMSKKQIAAVRGDKIAMVFQNPLTSLNPMMTVGDQIAESLLLHRGVSKAEATREAVSLLRQVGIAAYQRGHRPLHHALGMAAHGGDALGQIFQLLLIGADNVNRLHDASLPGPGIRACQYGRNDA